MTRVRRFASFIPHLSTGMHLRRPGMGRDVWLWLEQSVRRRRKEEGNYDLFHTSSNAFLHALRLGCECTRALHSRVSSVPCVITWLGALQYTGQAGAATCLGT